MEDPVAGGRRSRPGTGQAEKLDMKVLHAIGEPLENDFLEAALTKAGCRAQGDDRPRAVSQKAVQATAGGRSSRRDGSRISLACSGGERTLLR